MMTWNKLGDIFFVKGELCVSVKQSVSQERNTE